MKYVSKSGCIAGAYRPMNDPKGGTADQKNAARRNARLSRLFERRLIPEKVDNSDFFHRYLRLVHTIGGPAFRLPLSPDIENGLAGQGYLSISCNL
jgi:hypothetical protein